MILCDAIKHLEEVIPTMECSPCKEEHIQLLEWLQELKLLRELKTGAETSEELKAEVEELRYIVDQFAQWYNENGCPKHLNHDFPCSAEKEYKDDPDTDGDFDERDCWKEEYEARCWVEYYRWKYQQSKKESEVKK